MTAPSRQNVLVPEYVSGWPDMLGEYIVEHGATVRAAARAFGCSKSTVHKDVSVRLRTVGPELFRQVQMVLARNKAERHLRGGAATREKYHKPR